MNTLPLTSHMTIAEILQRWPETAAVFQRLRTACVGCDMAPFCSVNDAATHYDLDADQLLVELDVAVIHAGQPDAEGP